MLVTNLVQPLALLAIPFALTATYGLLVGVVPIVEQLLQGTGQLV